VADDAVPGEPVWGGKFPANRENNREFYENRAIRRKYTRQNGSKISLLQNNSLGIGTGKLFAPNRVFIEANREFVASCRELSAMRGNSARFKPPPSSGRENFNAEMSWWVVEFERQSHQRDVTIPCLMLDFVVVRGNDAAFCSLSYESIEDGY
jgi:hypothetical protein